MEAMDRWRILDIEQNRRSSPRSMIRKRVRDQKIRVKWESANHGRF